MHRILVIGGTGNVGGAVVSQLAAAGAQVRALARNPDPARLPENVEVVRGDLTAPETLDAGLRGVDAVFLVWIAAPDTIPGVIDRIARHARRIVFLSAPIKTEHPLFQQPNAIRHLHAAIERAIQCSGMEWTILRPGMFAANALRWWAPQLRAGDTVRWPYLAVPTAPIHERDIAAVAVRALCEDGCASAEYVLTGAQPLTHAEQIAIIGRVTGRALRVEELSPEAARSELLYIGPEAAVNMLLNAWGAAAGHPAFVSTTFAEITGRQPHTFEQWVSEYGAAFRA